MERLQKFFESQSKISGAELYNYAVKSAEKYGWEFGGEIAGHLIGHFPHERLDNEDKRNYVHPKIMWTCLILIKLEIDATGY